MENQQIYLLIGIVIVLCCCLLSSIGVGGYYYSYGGTGTTYTIAPGDSLTGVATKFGVTLEALISANPQISNPDVIGVGQVINIPKS